jgi:hypothetical protein
VLSLIVESTGNSHCLRNGRWRAQFVLSGTRDLAAGKEERLFKIFEDDADFGVPQEGRVSDAHSLAQLINGEAFREYSPDLPERYEPIRLNRSGLIKFWRKRELDLDHVTFAQPVKRTAFPRQGWTRFEIDSIAVRRTGVYRLRWCRKVCLGHRKMVNCQARYEHEDC